MGSVGWATLSVVPGLAGFGKKLSDGIGPQMDRAGIDGGKRFGTGLSSSAKGIGKGAGILMGSALVVGVTTAIAGISAVIKTGFGEAMDASKGTAQLTAGIKSTGGAAGVSVKGLNDLASSIQGYSGQTDDSIVASENLLLTFTNIKNKGPNKIFDLATKATADMAAKMGGSASDSAIQLGKALNDPIKGVSALSRVGVSFTQAQKDSIEAMVKSGDVAGAQKIILGELTTEFGGAAAAAGTSLPGQMAIAKRSFEDLSQTVVTGLMPAFSTGLAGINGFVQGVQKSFNEGGLSQVFTDLGTKISEALPGIQAKLSEMGTAFWAWIQVAVPPMLVKAGELLVKLETWLWTVAYPAIVAKLVQWGKAFVEWIGPMIPPALVALGAAGKQLFDWLITTGLPQLLTNLKKWATAFVAWIAPMIPPALVELGKLLGSLLLWIITDGVPKLVGGLLKLAVELVKWIAPMIPQALAALGGFAAKIISWIATDGLPMLRDKMLSLGSDMMRGLADGIRNAVSGVIEAAVNAAKSAVDAVKGALGINSPSKVFAELGAMTGQGFINGINATDTASALSNLMNLPGVGSLDFASPSPRSAAVAGGGNAGATSADIKALGDRIGAELDRQARTIQTMQRQMA